MKYVLDASVAIRWELPNALTPKALQLRDDYHNQIHELIAPSVYLGEIASALTKVERQKLIRVGQSFGLIPKILKTMPAIFPYEPLLMRAAEISSKTRCGFWDAIYAALGEREACEVVTADDKFLRAVQPTMPFVISLSALP
jgi:predicted nucleic acid-binding protein